MLHSYLPKYCILIYRNAAFLFTENLHCYLPITIDLNNKVLSSIAPRLMNAKIYQIPEIYFARVKGTNEAVSYTVLFINSTPLRYDFNSRFFDGKLTFIPIEIGNASLANRSSKTLSEPEDLFITYGSYSIALKIEKINWPPQEITIHIQDVVDSLEIKVCTLYKPDGYPKSLMVTPAIILSSNRSVFQGLGLQTIPVHVALKGVTKYKPVPITVEISKGSITENHITLTDDTPKELVIRSEGIGPINLNVVNPNYQSNTISLNAVFPWVFLLLSILGGLLGGIGKRLFRESKITVSSLILGCIIGLIVAFAYWGLGIKLIKFSISIVALNEAMVFGLALIAGFFGLSPESE